MSHHYRITQGTFLDSDGITIKSVGQTIELPDDVALRVAHQIDATPVDPVPAAQDAVQASALAAAQA